jgi:4-hydroxythreonine-4-phosphate dehydrogenase
LIDTKKIIPFVVTSGEPAGIGPDIALSLAKHVDYKNFVVFANINVLMERAQMMGLDVNFVRYEPNLKLSKVTHNSLIVKDFDLTESVVPGSLNQKNSGYVINMIEEATLGCLSGQFKGLITGPVHKNIINRSGIEFLGHTEHISTMCRSTRPIMTFVSDSMRLALATTHTPLLKISGLITANLLIDLCKRITKDMARFFGIEDAKIGLLGLNPHAGENGSLGNEETETILPAIQNMQSKGIHAIGPLAADTAFLQIESLQLDIVLAMYHDQGLPLFKYCNPHQSANVTLGIPIIRTSVDHGVALDKAGSGDAIVDSLHYAISVAENMHKYQNSAN